MTANGAAVSGGLGSKMPQDRFKKGLNSVEKITIFENTGKLIRKFNSPLTNCRNLVVKNGRSSGA